MLAKQVVFYYHAINHFSVHTDDLVFLPMVLLFNTCVSICFQYGVDPDIRFNAESIAN